MIQAIDAQSTLSQTSLETACCQGATNAADDTPPAQVPFRPGAMLAALSQTAKVMIVDDEPVNVKVVRKYLEHAGYQHFVTSTDPRPVMEMISQEMPDVILIDIMMPWYSMRSWLVARPLLKYMRN